MLQFINSAVRKYTPRNCEEPGTREGLWECFRDGGGVGEIMDLL